MSGESAETLHLLKVIGIRTRGRLVNFEPLTWEEYKAYSMHNRLHDLDPSVGTKLWLRPFQRLLQEIFNIDQRAYTSTTDPTLAELEDDFKIAASVTIDKFALNPDDVYGTEAVEGASRDWNHEIPERAAALLNRYTFPGGKSMRV